MGGYLEAEAIPIGESLGRDSKSRKLEDNLRICISHKDCRVYLGRFNLMNCDEGHI
jgi:hypothetical protein